MSAGSSSKRMHWPILVLGLVVAVILLCALFCFRVREVEHAFIVRLGEPVMSDNGPFKPGLHLKIPFIDRVWRYDRRLKAFSLDRGQIEQTQLADEHAVLVSTFVFWRVADPLRFYEAEGTVESAKNRLGENVRNARHNVLGRHRLDELLNVNPEKLNLDGIEEEMLQEVREAAKAYGVEVSHLGIIHVGFPEQVTQAVNMRMKKERDARAKEYTEQGKVVASRTRAEAEKKAADIIEEAETEAMKKRSEADAKAAESYAAFSQHPQLASFLRRLASLRETLDQESTLILDTNTPPFDLLKPDAMNIERFADPKDQSPAGTSEATEGGVKDGQ